MQFYSKVRKPNGRRHVYIFGIKCFSYAIKRERERERKPHILAINKDELDIQINSFTELGIAKESKNPKIIVSLTSFPQRMYDIHYALYSLLTQSYKPDMVYCGLQKNSFPMDTKISHKKSLNYKKMDSQ